MNSAIAIVGMACCYPDARSPGQLWENVLAQRQAFRRMPRERLRYEDYVAADPHTPDHTYSAEAALIEGYAFDRVFFRIARSTYLSADLAHWLALDVAMQALADAGFPGGAGLPRLTTGTLLGNTLTGEFSRAQGLRLRWPYMRRVVDAALSEEGWNTVQRETFLEQLEQRYKQPFAPVGEETLAGGLSNTIAGRICNYFDLKGGGYTLDGACASSLLAVTTACAALTTGDLDVALAGGVDLSLDPFELVGFAKAGALAREKMRIYDARSAGFWPGEGCGFVVLMRHEDAVAQGRRVYAVIRGWGVSSDGSGGITRPEVDGQILAIQRAYKRAGFGVETVAYFEGHGTGTSVGDATELQVLSRARREAQPGASPAAIGSIKANIGHTKAAAGIAGLIKATLALHAQIVPPTTGCDTPHALLAEADSALRVPTTGEIWPQQPLRAGVSAMGFGGINTHIVLEAATSVRRGTFSDDEAALLVSAQDAELFLLSAQDSAGLQQQVARLLRFAAGLSRAELADLAAQMAGSLVVGRVRAAIIATAPAELATRLDVLHTWLEEGRSAQLDVRAGVFLGTGTKDLRIGFLFPGQGSPSRLDGGALSRRFTRARSLYARAELPKASAADQTAVAQPAIVTASLAALDVLEWLGVHAAVAVGHSLGELTAFHWAGALDQPGVLRIARARGTIMAELGSPDGAMASIAASSAEVADLLPGDGVVIAGLNSPRQTVISGKASAVDAVMSRAAGKGLLTTRLPVSHAFHSPLIAAAAQPLAEYLRGEEFQPLRRTVISTVTGAALSEGDDVRALLYRQITSPVRFTEAVAAADRLTDLWIEVGPGQVLSRLATELGATAVIATDSGGPSLQGILSAVGAAFALGEPIDHQRLFADRFTRPFSLDWQPRFFTNPCELAPVPQPAAAPHGNGHSNGRVAAYTAYKTVVDGQPLQPPTGARARELGVAEVGASRTRSTSGTPLTLIHQLVADCAELPLDSVQDDSHLLSDLHLNSIAVSQIVVEAAQQLGLPRPANPTEYADATVAEVARALEELVRTGSAEPVDSPQRKPAGIDSWVRTFSVELRELPLPRAQPADGNGTWQVLAPPECWFADRLRQAFARVAIGHGVVVCLPPAPDEGVVSLLLEAARMVLQQQAVRFVLVQHGHGAAAFARTLYQEASAVPVCVVDVPPEHPQAADWVVAEALAVVAYTESYYDTDGRRREPVLRLLPPDLPAADVPLSGADVLVVTGGGKGITAECALALAGETGARLALLGRSQPAEDAELSANLERMRAAGIQLRYYAVDITDPDAVSAVIRRVDAELGPVTALLHGAARNVPQLLHALDEATVRQTLAPKITGLRNLLAAIDPDRLRLLMSFGSIIARIGLRGEADYALANEWLTRFTEQWQQDHPHCRCLAIEWSIWSEVGMGARLGGVDSLMRAGITPISPERGITILRELLSRRLPQTAVVVTGRFGDPLTLQMQKPELPFLRFLEQPRAYYPGIELIVDAELSVETDPYLNDHQFAGQLIFPAVMGLEAMSQVSRALAETERLPHFTAVQFKRPIVVPKQAALTIRLVALVQEPGRIDIAIRSAETAFQIDHFRATCCFGEPESPREGDAATIAAHRLEPLPKPGIDPQRDLYNGVLFHRGRFQRIVSYHHLAATECIAEIHGDEDAAWFGYYLPPTLALGDPGVRDAAIHAIQACVPNVTLLPIAVERVILRPADACGSVVVHARERCKEGDTFTYDMQVITADGMLVERWEGLKLRVVGGTEFRGAWVEPLLGPWLERQLRDLIPGAQVTVAVEYDPTADRRDRSDLAIQRALRQSGPIRRRPDGKVDAAGSRAVSAAHSGQITLAVAGPGPLGCDLEPVAARSASVWEGLLGHDRWALAQMIASETDEDDATAATRVWAATECLTKAGAMVDAPLLFSSSTAGGAVLLAVGSLIIATFVTQVRSTRDRLVFAVLVGSNHARL